MSVRVVVRDVSCLGVLICNVILEVFEHGYKYISRVFDQNGISLQ